MAKEKYYISTAIAYTSGKPHIGNTYEIVLADAIARYKRLKGYDVYFQTGTDEHGEKIEIKAKEAGITPKEYVDNISNEIKNIWDLMNTSYDKFVRTTDPIHEKVVQNIFKKMYDKGDIYKGEYKGLYCTPCESFWTESQLVDGKCPDCGRDVQEASEEAYFFKLSKYQDRLEKYIEDNPEFIQPVSRKNEMLNNFIKPGLQDLCVSRTSFSWGIPVDFDPKHVVYVWLDALTNYITNIGYDVDYQTDTFKKFWPADLHLIGKDIIRFHSIYWPCFLWSLDLELPKMIFGHPWLLMNNDKMSKSKGNVIYADDLVEKFGVDAVRYYLIHEIPFANDGNITYDLLVDRINSDLANILGNLVQRTISMGNKYFDGKISNKKAYEDIDKDFINFINSLEEKVDEKMEKLELSDAVTEIFNILRLSNKYIDETTPWILAKDEATKPRLGTVLYNLAETIRIIASMLSSFMPQTAQNIAKQIGATDISYESIKSFGVLKVGDKVGAAEPLFVRIDADKKLEELAAENAPDEPQIEIAPYKDYVEFEDFEKLDIRVGKVIECEKVPKSEKLLRFTLQVGNDTRQILSGISKYHTPEELIGKNVVFIANFKPRKMMGLESCGMILSAEHDGELSVLTTVKDIQSGAEIV